MARVDSPPRSHLAGNDVTKGANERCKQRHDGNQAYQVGRRAHHDHDTGEANSNRAPAAPTDGLVQQERGERRRDHGTGEGYGDGIREGHQRKGGNEQERGNRHQRAAGQLKAPVGNAQLTAAVARRGP